MPASDTWCDLPESRPPFPQYVAAGRSCACTGHFSPGCHDHYGFRHTDNGCLGGRILFSAQEGDANRSGDQALFGPTSATQVALSGPNNFANNFFASQINNDSGALNTTGTFGSRNQTNGSPGTNIIGGRQGWDITNVDVSARLVNNQSSALLTLTTSGDAYVVNANALQININAPVITLTKSSNVAGPIVGDNITYTVTINNTGTASATSVVLSDTLPTGLTFVAGSVVVAMFPDLAMIFQPHSLRVTGTQLFCNGYISGQSDLAAAQSADDCQLCQCRIYIPECSKRPHCFGCYPFQ